MELLNDATSRFFSSIPRPLPTVQRAELWRFILALPAFFPVYLGIDKLNVLNFVAEFLNEI